MDERDLTDPFVDGYFASGRLRFVPPHPVWRDMAVILSPRLYDKYEVALLDPPPGGMPPEWVDPITKLSYFITWVSSFQLVSPVEIKGVVSVEYEIQFEKPILNDFKDVRLFTFYDGIVEPFSSLDYVDFERSRLTPRISARLRICDPGIGLGGR